LHILKKLNLTPGVHTSTFAARFDQLRLQRANKTKLIAKKRRRIELAKKREALRKRTENSEGIIYQPNYGISANVQVIDNLIVLTSDNCNIVYFDIKTTGLHKSAEFIQLSTKCNDNFFNAYINPVQCISADATKITESHKITDQLYLHNEILKTVDLKVALVNFE